MEGSVSKSIKESKISGLPLLVISDGTLEGLKWFALIVMTLAHIDKYLCHQNLPGIFELGRIALPLFSFVLAYNLARPDSLKSGRYLRTLKRLAFFGLISSLFYIPLSGQLKGCFPPTGLLKGAYPLNIMFLLFVATGIFYLIDAGGPPADFRGYLSFYIWRTVCRILVVWPGVLFLCLAILQIANPYPLVMLDCSGSPALYG